MASKSHGVPNSKLKAGQHHRTHVSAGEYRTQAGRFTENSVKKIAKRLGVRYIP